MCYVVGVLSVVQDREGVRSKASYFAIDTDRKRFLTQVFTEGCQIGEECPTGDKYIRDLAARQPKPRAGKEFRPTRIYEPEPGVPRYARYKFEFEILKKESLRLELAKGLNPRLVVDSPLIFLAEAGLFERIANYIPSVVFVIYPEEVRISAICLMVRMGSGRVYAQVYAQYMVEASLNLKNVNLKNVNLKNVNLNAVKF